MELSKDQQLTSHNDASDAQPSVADDSAAQPAGRGAWGWRAVESFGFLDAADTEESHRKGCKERYKHISLYERLNGGVIAIRQSNAWSWRDAEGGASHAVADSYMLINHSAQAVAYYAIEYGKRGFVHCYTENGWIIGNYWELADPDRPYYKRTNTYIIKDECEVLIDTAHATDDCLIAGKLFSCRLPAKAIDYVNNKIIANLATINTTPEDRAYYIAKHGVGMTAYLYRKKAYSGVLNLMDDASLNL